MSKRSIDSVFRTISITTKEAEISFNTSPKNNNNNKKRKSLSSFFSNFHITKPSLQKLSSIYLIITVLFQSMAGLFLFAPVPQAKAAISWYNTSYSYRKQITIDRTKIPHTDTNNTNPYLTDFPMLVSLTDDNLKLAPNGKVQKEDGSDIIFANQSGTALLNCEIESYDKDNGTINAWVKIPQLNDINNTQNTVIYMYYGNANASANTEANIQGVWDSNFKMVQHMNQSGTNTAGDYKDSTLNNNDSINTTGQPTVADGKIGEAESFYGSGYIGVGSGEDLRLGNSGTVSAWIYPTGVGAGGYSIIYSSEGGADFDKSPYFRLENGKLSAKVGNGSDTQNISSGFTPSFNNWHFAVFTWNGIDAKVYLDNSIYTVAQSCTMQFAGLPYNIGAYHPNIAGYERFFQGAIDEVRAVGVARSADWIQTEYYNQSELISLYTEGAEESLTEYLLPPVLSEITPVSTFTNDITPIYTFSSTKSGEIAYGGDCFSFTIPVIAGNNTISFNSLAEGAHSNCTIQVTDAIGNRSNILTVSSFNIDTTAPTVTSVTTSLPSGTYDVGTEIPITVNFSEPVTTNFGNVTITLNNALPGSCSFPIDNSISGNCLYTVQAGDNANGLNVRISGTIQDRAGNALLDFIPKSNLSAYSAINIATSPLEADIVIGQNPEPATPIFFLASDYADDAACLQAALDASHNGDVIFIREGNYHLPRQVRQYGKDLTIIGQGTVNIYVDFEDPNHATAGLYLYGRNVVNQTAFLSDAAQGTDYVDLQNVSGVMAGDLIRIFNDSKWDPIGQPNQKTGETYLVKNISDNRITLETNLIRDYTVALNSQAIIYRPISVNLQNLSFRGISGEGYGVGLRLELCKNSSITGCYFENNGQQALAVATCNNVNVSGNTIINSDIDGLGYGVSIANASWGISVHDNTLRDCRHAISVGGSNYYGVNRDISVFDNIFYRDSGKSHIIDAHPQLINYTVTRNTIYADGHFAFYDASLYSVFSYNKIYNGIAVNHRGRIEDATRIVANNYIEGVGAGIFFQHDGVDFKEILIKDNILAGSPTADGVVLYKDIGVDNLTISGNTIKNSKNGVYLNLVDSVYSRINISQNVIENTNKDGIFLKVDDSKNFSSINIYDNVIRNANRENSAYYGIELANAAYGNIYGNKITDENGFAQYGVYEDGQCTYNRIRNNYISGMQSGAVRSGGASTVEENNGIISVNPAGPAYSLKVENGTGAGFYENGEVVPISADMFLDGKIFSGWTGDVSYILSDKSAPKAFIRMPNRSIDLKATYADYAGSSDSWYVGSYKYRKKITINHVKISNTDQYNFPVLVTLTDSSLKTVRNGGRVSNPNGYDIIFTSQNGASKFDHEVESYNGNSGTIKMWVKLPVLSHSEDTMFYMYYGNSDIKQSQENKTAVWDESGNNNFKGVWHMGESGNGNAGDYEDSTSNGNDSINSTNQPIPVAGQVNGAQIFNGSDSVINVGNDESLNITGAITLSAWVKFDSITNKYPVIVGKGRSWGNNNTFVYSLAFDEANNIIDWYIGDGITCTKIATGVGGEGNVRSDFIPGAWYHLVATWNGTKNTNGVVLYANGEWSGKTTSLIGSIQSTPQDVAIGDDLTRTDTIRTPDGIIDEVRISNIARSSDWIKTEYNNQAFPDTFYSFNIEETITSSSPFISPAKPSVSNISVNTTSTGTPTLNNLPTNITQIAISTNKDFTNVSWEDITKKEELLKQYINQKEIYIKFRTNDGGVSDVITYNPQTSTNTTTLQDGDIVKTPSSPDIYVIKIQNSKKYKRLILSPNVFNSYQHLKWENIKTISEEHLNQYQTSNLVKEATDTIIYTLTPNGDQGQRKPFDITQTYDPDSIYTINKVDRDSYEWEE